MLREESLEQLNRVGRAFLLECNAREADPAARIGGIERRRLLEGGASLPVLREIEEPQAAPPVRWRMTGIERDRTIHGGEGLVDLSCASLGDGQPIPALCLTIVDRHRTLVSAAGFGSQAICLAHHAQGQPVGGRCRIGRDAVVRRIHGCRHFGSDTFELDGKVERRAPPAGDGAPRHQRGDGQKHNGRDEALSLRPGRV